MDQTTLTISQLARRFGLNSSAIRYYEARGVLPEPARENGQRRYGADAVRRMEVLEVAKRAFSLDEARVLLRSAEAGTPAFEALLRELAARKLPEVEELVTRAQAMRDWLLMATDCSCTTLDACALFDVHRARPGRSGSPTA